MGGQAVVAWEGVAEGREVPPDVALTCCTCT